MAFAQKQADPVLDNPAIPANIKKMYADLPPTSRAAVGGYIEELYKKVDKDTKLFYLYRMKLYEDDFPGVKPLLKEISRDLKESELLGEVLTQRGVQENIIKLYRELPEDEKMLLGMHLTRVYAHGHDFDSSIDDSLPVMLKSKGEFSPKAIALFKEVLKTVENYYVNVITKEQDRVKDGKSDKVFLDAVVSDIRPKLEWLKRMRADPSAIFYETAFTAGIEERINKQEKFDADIPATVVQEGNIPKQQRDEVIKAIKHALASLPETLADLGLPPEQVIALREKLHEVTFVLVSEEEWAKKEYEPGAAGLCETGSDRILLRMPNEAREFALAETYGTVVHEILHHLSEGYSNNSNSRSLHEALTETFANLIVAKELDLPIRFTLREKQGETVPSRRFEVGSIVDFSNPSYDSLVMNDEFQELLAVTGRLEWQKAYFSGDYSEVKRQVNLYLPGNKDAFAYLFDDDNIEKSIVAADLKSVSTDWTEKFDKAKKPYASK